MTMVLVTIGRSPANIVRTTSKTGVPASVRSYKIVRVLPSERGEQLYRIKTIAEAFERIARESELLRTSGSS